MKISFTGIDPGLVHTGVVAFAFDSERRHFQVAHAAIDGPLNRPKIGDEPDYGAQDVAAFCAAHPTHLTTIEAYRPRSHFDSDARMGTLVNEIRNAVPGSKTLDNTGVTKIVLPSLMKLMFVWDFPTATHHQDLRAAARIGLYAALKNPTYNSVLYEFMRNRIDTQNWWEYTEGGKAWPTP